MAAFVRLRSILSAGWPSTVFTTQPATTLGSWNTLPNIEPGGVVAVADAREAIVTARVEAEPGWGQLVALPEVAIVRRR